ncbi:MAG: hypothetical protein A2X05_18130 [Bacteroidetes bacterium GWE2_41_25]|nr:MAG: hypothetical protein A2X03_08465 [Bacteroidetes bacterium GWA2_40_15]OFX98345.1 MAG: hypothetical protein A2X05_18130 [Bacteroidetes bacterium GWE2_41_25]OFY00708.1 MAG: hypothetical protein A2X06_05330 [Bacteroidetes bacterium GWC2_40_22]OFY59277.1 MAG: hypothetical protein A2X04_04820 [Bacteroidetes bacterium GWF2_41_9]HAM10412.1 hypothetical protein [Bacteroidales bacterium]
MKKGIILFALLAIIGCKEKQAETYFTAEKALLYFKKVEEICNLDNGRLWGKNLYGPLMFIDRETRRIISNSPDEEGFLKYNNGIYTGVYPRYLLISNSPLHFGGVLFAMAPLPSEEDEFRITARAVHSLFHRFQEMNGLSSSGYNTNNMDEKQARLWIKLEWKALRKAITSEGNERNLAIRDALIFRGANRELYQNDANDENHFENYEGLATFTYTLLGTSTCEEYRTKLFENLDRIYAMQSYARSYGFIHGALYATLLHESGFNFTMINSPNFDLGKAVKELYSIDLPEFCRDVAGSIALNYDIPIINEEEEKRLADIRESVNKQISLFTEKPVVYFALESPYFDFEPENLQSFDTLGTIYNSIRVSDNWGKLTVDKGGCLVSNNFKRLRITAKGFKAERNRISGDGWNLILNDGWEMIVVGPNYYVRKLMP